jgi:hypothetical protein
MEDDGSGKPYRVDAADGKTWWYQTEALEAAQVKLCSAPCTCKGNTFCIQFLWASYTYGFDVEVHGQMFIG